MLATKGLSAGLPSPWKRVFVTLTVPNAAAATRPDSFTYFRPGRFPLLPDRRTLAAAGKKVPPGRSPVGGIEGNYREERAEALAVNGEIHEY